MSPESTQLPLIENQANVFNLETNAHHPPSPGQTASSLAQIQPHAAGIDVGANSHWVCVPEHHEQSVREFGCFTTALNQLADWLETCGIKSVAMESTGVYWIPLFQILESRGMEVCLVNARSVKNVPGRKTDVLDCQWIQQLHSFGLLSASFRPDDQICVLRSYIRHREALMRSSIVHVHRMQKALDQMNLHLHRVLTDITGKTGMNIIRAIVSGERNPKHLASFRDPRVKRSEADIAAALTGNYREELLFILKQELSLYDTYRDQMSQCDREIEQYLKQFEDKIDEDDLAAASSTRRRKPKGNTPKFDLHTHLYRISGVDFTQIAGLDTLSVLNIISEVGLDPTRFPSVKNFCSWLGLSPGSNITGGKVKNTKTRKVVNRAANAFRLAAQSLHHSNSALGAYYRRLKSRLGPAKAITATAHKLARMFYSLWRNGGSYVDPGVDAYEKQYQERVMNNLQRRAKTLGCKLVPLTSEGGLSESVS